MRKIIAIDVDLTVVDTFNPWMKWFEEITGGIPIKNEDGAYDLVPEMREILKSIGKEYINPFAFWCRRDLYDELEPLDWVETAIRDLHRQGHIVLFVSTCVPEHKDSKQRFLKKCFNGRYNGFIDTADKHFVSYDALIDDKLYHHRVGAQYRPDAKHILYTGVRADGKEAQRDKFIQMASWGEINAKLGF